VWAKNWHVVGLWYRTPFAQISAQSVIALLRNQENKKSEISVDFGSKVGTGWSGRAINRPVIRLCYPSHCVKISSWSRNAFASYVENIFFLICILRTADNGQRTTNYRLTSTPIFFYWSVIVMSWNVKKTYFWDEKVFDPITILSRIRGVCEKVKGVFSKSCKKVTRTLDIMDFQNQNLH